MVVQRIHDYLTTISESVRGGKMNMENFIIWKVRVKKAMSILK